MTAKGLGLALSGGGSLGAYQVGVLKALETLNWRPSIKAVAGTSIGSINGAFFVGDQLEELQHLWLDTPIAQIFSRLKNHPSQNKLDPKAYQKLAFEFFTTLKVDVNPFKALIRDRISESVIRNAPIAFYLNLWNVFKFRGEQYALENIPKGELAEYIIASSSFPLFWPHKIHQSWYLDGGIDLNLPLTIPFDHNAVEHVIAVDVATYMKYRPKQVWLTHKFKDKITLIRPSRSIGSPAHFSREKIKDQIALGYEDAMTTLAPLESLII